MVSLVLAALATPLVLSVHSIVSMDFATSLVPGWHTTIFPPYFVAGAIYSGFGMVLTLLIITRQTMNLRALHHASTTSRRWPRSRCSPDRWSATRTRRSSSPPGIGGNLYERFHFINRATGPYAWCF